MLAYAIVAIAALCFAILLGIKKEYVMMTVMVFCTILILYVGLLEEMKNLLTILNNYKEPQYKVYPKDRYGRPKLKVIKGKKNEV